MKIVQFGAGNIGRGLIYPWLRRYSDDIFLIDNNKDLVHELNKENKYTIFDTDNNETVLTGINIIHSEDKCISELFKNVDIVITSVGVNNLKHIANTIINNIALIDNAIFICFENSPFSGNILKEAMMELVKYDIKLLNIIQKKFTFINGVIDCIIPDMNLGLNIIRENYSEWYIDLPNNINIDLFKDNNINTVNFQYYIDRKLYLFNISHWAIAYYGLSKGYKYIYDAWNDIEISEKVCDILFHTCNFLIKKYPERENDINFYLKNVVNRFSNKNINDTLQRVARDPLRKYDFIKKSFNTFEESNVFNILLEEIEKNFYK